jgi:hypothetical protein
VRHMEALKIRRLPVINKSVCRQSISDSWLGYLRECLAHLD